MTLNVIILGVMISIIFYEITKISPGGIIVPGLLVVYITQIDRIIYTIIIAIVTYLIVKLLSKYLVIFGKRRFVLMIIISIFLSFILDLIMNSFSSSFLSVSIIGYTIAGIIANETYKQGIKRTIPSLVIVVAIIELLVIIINQVGF